MWVNEKTKLKEIWRLCEQQGNRFYFSGKKRVRSGITTILQNIMPTSKHLLQWFADNGEAELQRTADLGSLLHLMILRFIKGEDWWTSILPGAVSKSEENLLRKWMVSMRNFEQDYFPGITPLLLEVPLGGKIAGCEYACTIDFLSEIIIPDTVMVEGEEVYRSGKNKGQKKMVAVTNAKRVMAIVDFKSNPYEKDKKFYDSHLFQLLAQKQAVFMQTGIVVERIFNWTPTAWREDNGANTYKLVEWVLEGQKPVGTNYQTYTNKDVKQFYLFMKLAKLKGINTPSGNIVEYKNFLRGDDTPSIEKLDYQTYVSKKS